MIVKFDNCPWTVALPETFRPITFPTVKQNMYAVSDYGTIINAQTGLIKEQRNNNGYRVCSLMRSDFGKGTYRVHRLVAWEFCPGRDINLTVNHIDCNKHNNYYENLEWVTSSENTKHAIAHGLFENCTPKILTDEAIHYFYQTFQDPSISYKTMSSLIKEKFGLVISPRTLKHTAYGEGPKYMDQIKSQYSTIPPRNRLYPVGESHPSSILTTESVRFIIDLYLNTSLNDLEIVNEVKEKFGVNVHKSTIRDIINGLNWKDVSSQYASLIEARKIERRRR